MPQKVKPLNDFSLDNINAIINFCSEGLWRSLVTERRTSLLGKKGFTLHFKALL